MTVLKQHKYNSSIQNQKQEWYTMQYNVEVFATKIKIASSNQSPF